MRVTLIVVYLTFINAISSIQIYDCLLYIKKELLKYKLLNRFNSCIFSTIISNPLSLISLLFNCKSNKFLKYLKFLANAIMPSSLIMLFFKSISRSKEKFYEFLANSIKPLFPILLLPKLIDTSNLYFFEFFAKCSNPISPVFI